jgi:tRNA pseudouridine13 synthase
LRRRICDRLFATVLDGDLLQKRDTGGMFVCDNIVADQERLARMEVTITGPMYGHRMRSPRPGSHAAERERELLAEEGLELSSFRHLGKLALGARRPLSMQVGSPSLRLLAEGALEVGFELPAGAYATAVMRELMKGENNFPA